MTTAYLQNYKDTIVQRYSSMRLLDPSQTSALFIKEGVFDFIDEYYDVLGSHPVAYGVRSIAEYLEARSAVV
jgi:hypothetical protein